MVLLGAALVVFSLGDRGGTRRARVLGGNVPINAGARDERVIEAHNSPSMARNPVAPENLALANRVDTPAFSCALHVSNDAGVTWEKTEIPVPEGEEPPPRCFAPDVAFGSDGTMYVSFVMLKGSGNVPNSVWIVTSTDRGRTLSVPTKVSGPFAFQVRLLADRSEPGRLYLSWLQSDGTAGYGFPTDGNPIVFTASDDGGTTWRPPSPANHSSRRKVLAPSAALGPRGQLYLLFVDVKGDSLDYHAAHEGEGGEPYPGSWSLVLARSDDDGASWHETVVEEELVPTERFVVFEAPTPSVAVDPRNGWIYAGFHDGRLGDPDVWIWTSRNEGASFGAAARANDNPTGDGTSQHLPALAVSTDGRLDLLYYDRRADPQNRMTGVTVQSSSDGATFTPGVSLSDRAFDSTIGFGSERSMPDLGSRLALLSTERRALAVWTDTRGGADVANKQDLARAVVAFDRPSSTRSWARAAGLLMLGAGALAISAAAVVRARRSSPLPDRKPENPEEFSGSRLNV